MKRHFDNPKIDIFIGNVPYHIDDQALFELASKFGKVVDLRIVRNTETDESRGYAFARAATPEDQKAIIAGLHGRALGARTLQAGPLIRGGPARGGG